MFLGNATPNPNTLRQYAFSAGIMDAGGMLVGEREGDHERANASARRLYDYALQQGIAASYLDSVFGWLPGTVDTWTQNNGLALLRGQSAYSAPAAAAAPVAPNPYTPPPPPVYVSPAPATYNPPGGGVSMPAPPADPMTFQPEGPAVSTPGPGEPVHYFDPAPPGGGGVTDPTFTTVVPRPRDPDANSGGVPWGLLALAAAAAFLA